MDGSSNLPSLRRLDAAGLTDLLLAGPALECGSVTRFEVLDRKRAGGMGRVHSVRVEYSQSAGGARPPYVAWKRTRPDVSFSRSEIRFYAQLAPHLVPGIAPRMWAGRYCVDTRQYVLVLEDLSPTHRCRLGGDQPPLSLAEMGDVFARLAELHASWWGRPLDGHPWHAADIGRRTAVGFERCRDAFRRTQQDAPEFFSDRGVGDLHERYFRAGPAPLTTWLAESAPRALLHGDAHVGNVLFPRPGHDGAIAFVDWGDHHLGPPVHDLSYPLLWSAAECREFAATSRLLERYHDSLQQGGVVDYPLDALRVDFRRAVLDNLRATAGPWLDAAVGRTAHAAAVELIEAWDAAALLPKV